MKHLFIIVWLLVIIGFFPVDINAAIPTCFSRDWGSLEVLRVPLFGSGGESDICRILVTGRFGSEAVGYLISQIVILLTALVMMAAAVGIVIGGYIYMTAGGSADRVQVAKAWITAALLGIVIALTAWVILNTIQPAFVN